MAGVGSSPETERQSERSYAAAEEAAPREARGRRWREDGRVEEIKAQAFGFEKVYFTSLALMFRRSIHNFPTVGLRSNGEFDTNESYYFFITEKTDTVGGKQEILYIKPEERDDGKGFEKIILFHLLKKFFEILGRDVR